MCCRVDHTPPRDTCAMEFDPVFLLECLLPASNPGLTLIGLTKAECVFRKMNCFTFKLFHQNAVTCCAQISTKPLFEIRNIFTNGLYWIPEMDLTWPNKWVFTNSSMLMCTGEATATQTRVNTTPKKTKKQLNALKRKKTKAIKCHFFNIWGDFIKCSDGTSSHWKTGGPWGWTAWDQFIFKQSYTSGPAVSDNIVIEHFSLFKIQVTYFTCPPGSWIISPPVHSMWNCVSYMEICATGARQGAVWWLETWGGEEEGQFCPRHGAGGGVKGGR